MLLGSLLPPLLFCILEALSLVQGLTGHSLQRSYKEWRFLTLSPHAPFVLVQGPATIQPLVLSNSLIACARSLDLGLLIYKHKFDLVGRTEIWWEDKHDWNVKITTYNLI